MTETITYIKSAEECYAAFIYRRNIKKTIKERQEERTKRMTFPLTIGKIGHRNQCWNCLKMNLFLGPPSKKMNWTADDFKVYMGEMWCMSCCGDDGFKGGMNNEEAMYELMTSVKNGIISHNVGDFREERKCDCGCWRETLPSKTAAPSKTADDDEDINEQVIYKGRAFD